ncbi:MAG: TonB-dependent receptor [Rhodanobacter sp.]|jgi:iron complex outermembrane receptor protein|nr:TonB-dependent receptor [Rhodanobacter sp.]
MNRFLFSTSLTLFFFAQPVFADSSDTSTELPRIIVSASRDDATLAEIPQSTTIITRQHIDDSPAQSLDQLLRNVASINLSSIPAASKDPTGQSLSMRGLGNSTVLVLLDGVPIMDPFYGTVQWFKVPLATIDRIEIVRGGSVVWGNMAVGGVINIITQKPKDNRGTLSASYGSFGTKNASLSKNFTVNDALGLNLSVDRLDSSGYQLTPSPYLWRYPDKRPIRTRDTNAQMTVYLHPSSDVQGYLRLGYHINDEKIFYAHGDNKQTSPDFAASLSKALNEHSSLTASTWAQEVTFGKYNAATCYWKPTGGCLSLPATLAGLPAEQANDPVAQYYTQYGDQSYHERGFSATYLRTLGTVWRDIQVGLDYRRLNAADNESIYNAPTIYGVPVGTLAASVTGRGTQDYSGLFMQTRVAPMASLLVTLAAREDRFSSNIASTEGDNPQLSGGTTKTRFDPSLSARYFVNDALSLRASVNQTFRGPGLNNTLRSYGSVSSTPSIADPYLVPQDMLGREIGIHYDRDGLGLSATYFFYGIRNVILSTTSPAAGAPSAYQEQLCNYFLAGFSNTLCNFYSNAGDERSRGVELLGSYRVSPHLLFNGAFTLTDAVLTRTSTNTPVRAQIAGIPRLVGSLGVLWSPLDKLQLEAQAHYIGRMNYYSSTTAGTYSQGSNTVLDVGGRYHLTAAIDLTLAVNNLLNRTYTDSTWTYNQPYTQTLAPARMAYLGIRVMF